MRARPFFTRSRPASSRGGRRGARRSVRAPIETGPRLRFTGPFGYAPAVTVPAARPVFVLNIHADYACRQTGLCCAAGWDIPVEADVARIIEAALANGSLHPANPPAGRGVPLLKEPPPPEGSAAVLAKDTSGACVFLDRSDSASCRIHRTVGHRALPAACRQFPRVALLDPRGVHVTLSHFCPTAASTLLRQDVAGLSIVGNSLPFTAREDYEGFDATTTIPPLVRPGVAFDLDSYARWEAGQIRTLGRDDLSADDALGAIAWAAESVRAWTPRHGVLRDWIERRVASTLDGAAAEAGWSRGATPIGRTGSHAVRTFGRVARLVRAGLTPPSIPADVDTVLARLVGPAWSDFSQAVRRYLAAKAFAAWSAYQGDGVRTSVAVLGVALDVLAVECARQAGAAGRQLDAPLLVEAFRHADLLLEHLVDRADLVRLAAPVEALDSRHFLEAVCPAAR